MKFFSLFGKSFKCASCGEKFKTQDDLKQHNQIEHRKST